MEIKNIEEYVLASLAICGEMKALGIGQRMPYSETYALRHIQDMVGDGLIRKYDYGDSKYYRLSKKGIEIIKSTTPALSNHMDLMIGQKGDRYKGAKEKRKKKRCMYDITEIALRMGLCVDFIKLTPDSVNIEQVDGELKDFVSRIDEKMFITKAMLRSVNGETDTHPRNHMYRTQGIFFSGGVVFPTYYMSDPEEKYWHDVEMGFLNVLTKTVKENYRNPVSRYSGIFYTSRKNVLEEYLFPGKRVYRFAPSSLYNIFYMIPMDCYPELVTKLILMDGWKEKTNSLLIEGPGRKGDGTSSNGLPVYNFLGNNIALMRKNAPAIKNEKSVLILHDWQVEFSKKMFGENHELRVVESEMLKAVISDIDGL